MSRYEQEEISLGDNEIDFDWIEIELGGEDDPIADVGADGIPGEQDGSGKSASVHKSVIRELLSYVIIAAVAALIYVIVSNFVIINANVPTKSMVPTINAGDRLLGFRMAYLFSEPERGDVVIFEHKCYENEEPELLVKRIVGMPGDTIEIKSNKLYINGIVYVEPYLSDVYMPDFGPYEVSDDSYFMMGDNRTISNDARNWTYKDVPESEIIAKAWLKYYPEVELVK